LGSFPPLWRFFVPVAHFFLNAETSDLLPCTLERLALRGFPFPQEVPLARGFPSMTPQGNHEPWAPSSISSLPESLFSPFFFSCYPKDLRLPSEFVRNPLPLFKYGRSIYFSYPLGPPPHSETDWFFFFFPPSGIYTPFFCGYTRTPVSVRPPSGDSHGSELFSI